MLLFIRLLNHSTKWYFTLLGGSKTLTHSIRDGVCRMGCRLVRSEPRKCNEPGLVALINHHQVTFTNQPLCGRVGTHLRYTQQFGYFAVVRFGLNRLPSGAGQIRHGHQKRFLGAVSFVVSLRVGNSRSAHNPYRSAASFVRSRLLMILAIFRDSGFSICVSSSAIVRSMERISLRSWISAFMRSW